MESIKAKITDLVALYAEQKFKKNKFIAGVNPIPPSGKVLGELELQYMVEASLDAWLTSGDFNDKFEQQLAKYLKVKHVLTTNSGSSANLLAFSALSSSKLGARAIKAGDEVITVAAGFPTTVNPIIQNGLIPVFVDVELGTYNIDITQVAAAITSKTKVIFLAHTLGNPYNLKIIRELCDQYQLWLIEDCCDALGSKYNEQMVGTFGDIATISFYPAHHITMGEGGAVFTNNDLLKLIVESFRDWGRDCYCRPAQENTCGKRFCQKLGDLPLGYDHKYTYSHMGYNLKITEMQAACGLAQLSRLDDFIFRRRHNFNYLKTKLAGCQDLLILPQATINSEPSWFGFPLTVKNNTGLTRHDLINYLNDNKIGTRLLFAGNITKQPYMQGRNYRIHGQLTNTDIIMSNTFWVGIYPALDEEMLDYSATIINQFCGLEF